MGLDQTVANDVLAVPVTALVALVDGGYGVEKVLADGTHALRRGHHGRVRRDARRGLGDDLAEGDEVVVTP